MATYFVGDLQGCYDELQRLLETVNFDTALDRLYLVGDLVARGDKSLECLRFVKSLGSSAQTVLGNHDLHLISTALGIKKIKIKDRVQAIFDATDFMELIDWLRHQPLLIHNKEQNWLMSHAGISPQWDLITAKQCAKEVETVLQQGDFHGLLTQMYDQEPRFWQDSLTGIDRLRYIINAFTRMRFCESDGSLDFDCKLPPQQAPESLRPWFQLANPLYNQTNVIFGHWASLVDYPTPANIFALDTGCVWNNRMTMLRWEDKQLFIQPALKNYR